MDGDTIMQDVLKKVESGEVGRGSNSDSVVVKSVALTVQFLIFFKVRWDFETTLPFGVLTTGVQVVPICQKSIYQNTISGILFHLDI